MFIDFEKSYNSGPWEFLIESVSYFNVGDKFVIQTVSYYKPSIFTIFKNSHNLV